MKSITIGNSVSLIENHAFNGCGALTECYCYAINPPAIYDDVFTAKSATLYVPIGCGSAYKSSAWEYYFEKIVEMEEYLCVEYIKQILL